MYWCMYMGVLIYCCVPMGVLIYCCVPYIGLLYVPTPQTYSKPQDGVCVVGACCSKRTAEQ